ncbi:MAG: hypothetical protein AAFX53_19390, partial [Bacteroidota bacterium]
MYKRILLFIFLTSGAVFSQTTITLEDQCNCEVLKGTEVSAPNSSSPAGADIGDLYVNTNTGTIYFWDGDSWELTATDNQQVDTFDFDPLTGELTLEIQGDNLPAHVVDLGALDGDGNISSPGSTIDVGGDPNALLANVTLDVEDNSITTTELANNAVHTENILSGGNDQVLVTDATGTVEWVDKGNLDTDDQAISSTVLTANETVRIDLVDGGDTTIDIRDGDSSDTNEIELPAGGTNGQVLSTDGGGTYSWVDDNGGSDDQAISSTVLTANETVRIDLVDGG